jgi:hypothetical protein
MDAMRSTAHCRIPSGLWTRVALTLALAHTAGCSSMMRTDTFKGACGPVHDQCVAGCKEIKDWETADTCISACQSESRRCELRQRPGADDALGTDLTQRKAVTDVGPPKVQLVDFSPGRIESSGVSVNAQGAVRQAGDVFELMPGGSLTIGFTAPPDAREAELEIEHGAGGGRRAVFRHDLPGGQDLAGAVCRPASQPGRRAEERAVQSDAEPAGACAFHRTTRRRGR